MKKVLLMIVFCVFLMQGVVWGEEKGQLVKQRLSIEMPDYSLLEKQVTDLAKRLGIKPISKNDGFMRYVISGEDDKCYDMFELISGILNKMDEKLKQSERIIKIGGKE